MPSEDTQWKPGQSGNPSGRPKGSKSLVAALRKYATMPIEELGRAGSDDSLPVLESIAAGMMENLYWCAQEVRPSGAGEPDERSRSRDELIKAFREVCDRIDGKPTQRNENTHQIVEESITLEDRGHIPPELGEGQGND